MRLTRRTAILGALAAPAIARADADRFGPVLDRARGLDQLHSVSIALDGETVLAEAVRGPALSRARNVKSVSKSIVAALTGIAIGRGALPGVDVALGDVAPGLVPAGADPRVPGITVADLLTLRAGLERTSGPAYGEWVSSADWVADALSRPMVAPPGGPMLYSTGTTHVLGAVLAEVTGQSLLALARDWLGRPLGFEVPAWTRDPQGRYLGGNEMALTPDALIRIGEAHRQGGQTAGTAVLDPDWIAEAWTPRTRSRFSGHDYGYGWFLAEARGHFVAYARGYGGQMIYVVPEAQLTVAITSDPTRPARSAGYAGALFRLLADDILPAVV